jgi:hydroxymethylglutaryl-CoA lyase
MRWPERAEVCDVTARDGLQSLETVYPVATRVRVIELLREAGVRDFEVGSFVRPDVIPQLAGTADVLAALPDDDGCKYRVLVPNRRGAELALEAGARHLVGMSTASESYTRKNSRMSVDEAVEGLVAVAGLAAEAGASLAVGIGMAMFCPYDGDTPIERVLATVGRLSEAGVHEFTLAASVGVETPREVAGLCERVAAAHPKAHLTLHLHNLNGMALANALAGLDAGVTHFESVATGVGGGIVMPAELHGYGNVATEDLVAMLAGCGVETGIDPAAMVGAARSIVEVLGLERSHGFASGGLTRPEVLEAQGG